MLAVTCRSAANLLVVPPETLRPTVSRTSGLFTGHARQRSCQRGMVDTFLSCIQRTRRRWALPFQRRCLQRVLSPWLPAMREHQGRQHLGITLLHHMPMAILSPRVRPVLTFKSRLAVSEASVSWVAVPI